MFKNLQNSVKNLYTLWHEMENLLDSYIRRNKCHMHCSNSLLLPQNLIKEGYL
jgi:hypothetical protein